MNFTWWVNRKDANDRNIFQGGFLGLDNIGVFDRSQPLPTGGYLEQSDATSWMAMYALNLLKIALELAQYNPVYEDIASKFFEHFLSIAYAMSESTGHTSLWNEEDGLFYDSIHLPDGSDVPLKIHSMVSLIPLFAVEVVETDLLDKLPGFARRFEWFMENRPELTVNVSQHCREERGGKDHALDCQRGEAQLRLLEKLLDENEFLSPYGVRSVSKYHEAHPYELRTDGVVHRVDYNPGESESELFGGNSNWRGPVWMPVNYLLIESLQKFTIISATSSRWSARSVRVR